MKICFVFPVLIVLLSACQVQNNTHNPRHSEAIGAIDSLAMGLVLDGHTAGVAWGIQIGETRPFVKTYGMADVEAGEEVSPTTRFNLASITKPFTATAIGILIDEGRLALDDPLTKFFPSFPDGDKVTLYHLLSHTSGIADWWVGGLPEGTPGDWTLESAPHRYLAQMETVYLFEPGSHYAYSNSGYVLLGEIIETVSEKPYSTFLSENLFTRLGMADTRLADAEVQNKMKAMGYRVATESDNNAFAPVSFGAHTLKAAGAIESTVNDLLLWTSALFEGDIIEDRLVARMVAYATTGEGTPVYEALYMPPGMPEPEPIAYMKKNGYGLGFNRTEMYGESVVWHSGGMPGFNAIWVYLPETETAFVILANTDNGAVPLFEEAMRMLTNF